MLTTIVALILGLPLAFAVVAGFFVRPAAGWRAKDGDTIIAPWGETFRLLGIDAPEIHGSCEDERRAGEAAKARLQALLDDPAGVTLDRKTNRAGLQKREKYGRPLATLRVGRRDVAEILKEEGLARDYDGGKREDWCEGHGDVAAQPAE
jgi:endonuclease YncB( thermonuclease family)